MLDEDAGASSPSPTRWEARAFRTAGSAPEWTPQTAFASRCQQKAQSSALRDRGEQHCTCREIHADGSEKHDEGKKGASA